MTIIMRHSFSTYYADKSDVIDNHWFSFTQIQFDWILTRLKSHYANNDKFTVIDLGCGTGRLLSLIADEFPNAVLHGVDGTPEMIHKSRERLKGRCALIQGDLNEYVPTHHYDVVISTTVLHHLDEPETHLQTIQNALKTDGHAFISEFALDTLPLKLANLWWTKTQPSHKQAWTSRALQKIITKNGFTITDKAILKPDHFWRLQIYDLV